MKMRNGNGLKTQDITLDNNGFRGALVQQTIQCFAGKYIFLKTETVKQSRETETT